MIETPAISPEHKNFASQLISELPKVTIHEQLPTRTQDGAAVTTREELAAHIQSTVHKYRDDNVVYLELRVVVEDFAPTTLCLPTPSPPLWMPWRWMESGRDCCQLRAQTAMPSLS